MRIKDYKTQTKVQMKKYYLIYCRKSSESEDRQMESIPAQIAILNDIAQNRQLHILKTFKESQSAKKPGRPFFNELVRMIDERNDIKGIICWKPNRLFRNPEDEGKIRQRLSDGRIEEIITPSKIYLEADSDFMMAVEGAQAQRFIRDLREDTQRGINHKLDLGMAPVLASPGYVNNTFKRQGEKDISPHSLYFTLMRKVFDLALTGNYTIEQLVNQAKALGIKNSRNKEISKSQMARILRNPFYTGKYSYKGELLQGIHKPMLTEEEFDLLQDIMSGRSRPRKVRHDFLTGLIHCGECKGMVTAESHTKQYKNGKSQTFEYYRCTKKKGVVCTQPYINAKKLEAQVCEYLEKIKISEKFVRWAVKWINDANGEQMEAKKAQIIALQKDYNDVLKMIDNLLNLKISPGNIDGAMLSEEKYKEKNTELMTKKKKLKKALNKIDKLVDEWIEFIIAAFNFTVTAQKRFKEGDMNDKKIILRAIGSNLYLLNGELTIQPRQPFIAIEKAVNEMKKQNKPLEPKEVIVYKGQEEDFVHQNLIVGGIWGSNPRPRLPQRRALTN